MFLQHSTKISHHYHSFSRWVIWIITHCKFWVITQSLMLAWLPKCENYVGKSWVQMRYDAIPVVGEDDMKSLFFLSKTKSLVLKQKICDTVQMKWNLWFFSSKLTISLFRQKDPYSTLQLSLPKKCNYQSFWANF